MKKIIFLLLLFFSAQVAMSQSMSDKEVAKFIVSEQEKGATPKEIATKLAAEGVTMAQINRVKSNLQSMKTESQRVNDDRQSRYNNRMNSQFLDNRDLSDEEKQQKYEEEQGVVDIEKQIMPKDTVIIFGRNIFNNKLLTFETARNTPVPSTYVLGAGDQIIIDVWGASQAVINDAISPEGYLMINGVGPLYLAGKTVAEANSYVKEALGEVYSEGSINLSVAYVRSITVQVLGEVTMPGSYTLSALSTAFHALYAAGGISGVGTLRDIKVYRAGKLLTTIDVYEYILKGKTADNVHLQDNDVVSVGTYNILANIQGKVKRPMFYEMKEGEKLSSLFEYSGGYTADAYRDKVRVIRKTGRQYSMHTIEKDEYASFAMCDGDHVTVDSMLPRYSNMVEINGAVFYPGQYQFGDKVKTVRDLIEAAGGVREDAFLERAVLHHRYYDNTIEAQAVDINGILYGGAADVELRNNDAIFIPSRSDMEGDKYVKVYGEINFPGMYKFAENTTLQDIILQAGGLTHAASMAKIDVYRNKHNPYATQKEFVMETFSFEFKNGYLIGGDSQFVLEPYDEVHLRRNPTYHEIRNVNVKGEVNFRGEYAMSKGEYRLSDLIKDAGGITKNAYVKGAFLYRRMSDLEKEKRDIIINETRIRLYEELLNAENYDKTILDSLINAKLSSATTYQVAINLEAAIANPGGEDDIILLEGDELTVPQISTTVKVMGEVRQPMTMAWRKGEGLKYYIEHAGGYSDEAKKRAVYVVHMNGNISKMTRFSKKNIEPGAEIVVPRKRYIKRNNAAELMAYTTTATSIASMIALILTAVK